MCAFSRQHCRPGMKLYIMLLICGTACWLLCVSERRSVTHARLYRIVCSHVLVCLFRPRLKLYNLTVSQSCPLFLLTHTHIHAHTHSNRWLILTEIIRQHSHQHGSVVIRVWTQCLFSSSNGRSAWRKRREMHYSP